MGSDIRRWAEYFSTTKRTIDMENHYAAELLAINDHEFTKHDRKRLREDANREESVMAHHVAKDHLNLHNNPTERLHVRNTQDHGAAWAAYDAAANWHHQLCEDPPNEAPVIPDLIYEPRGGTPTHSEDMVSGQYNDLTFLMHLAHTWATSGSTDSDEGHMIFKMFQPRYGPEFQTLFPAVDPRAGRGDGGSAISSHDNR